MAKTTGGELSPSAGGKARAAKLSPQRRSEISSQGANARWNVPQATHAGEVNLGGQSIPCAVLNDGRRVLTQAGFLLAIGRASKAHVEAPESSEVTLPPFLASEALKSFISEDLIRSSRPISFRTPVEPGQDRRKSRRAVGYDATLLPKVCEVYVRAKQAGETTPKQEHVVQACVTLLCGFAQVGIAALIDEATGYQEVRDRRALQAILDRYLREELAAWAKRFPDDFYKEMFRLKGWTWRTLEPAKGPRCVAYYTKDVVYERLAPGILDELERRNPVEVSGRRRAKHHQWFNDDIGHQALSQHIHATLAVMRLSRDWDHFAHNMDRTFPRQGRLVQLNFEDVAPGFSPADPVN